MLNSLCGFVLGYWVMGVVADWVIVKVRRFYGLSPVPRKQLPFTVKGCALGGAGVVVALVLAYGTHFTSSTSVGCIFAIEVAVASQLVTAYERRRALHDMMPPPEELL